MRTKFVNAQEVHDRISGGGKMPTHVRLASQPELTVAEDRVVKFVFSDGSVDRYGDTIDPRGWQLDHYRANPVVLFGHNDKTAGNVIGKCRAVSVDGAQLVGEIEFAPASANPDAEVVFQLVKGGFLSSVSVGFQPIEWSLAKDKSRVGGVDFRKQELLEVSVVPIPANANALVQARAAGIDVDRLALVQSAAPAIAEQKAARFQVKSLYDVSWLACILADLSVLEECLEWSAMYEGEESEIVARLGVLIKELGQVLVDMTADEVAAIVAEETGERSFPAIVRTVLAHRKEGRAPTIRAGKTISAATEKSLRDAHQQIAGGLSMIAAMIEPAEEPGDDESEDDPEDDGRAQAKAVAEALRLKAS